MPEPEVPKLSIYRMLPESALDNLSLHVDQALDTLRSALDSLLHAALSQRLPPQACLSLVPVNVDTRTQDGETYLTVRYRFQVKSLGPDSPSNSK